MSMLNTIRKIIQDYLDYIVLSDVVTGTIVSVQPLEVRIDANISLTEEFLKCNTPVPPGAIGQSVTLVRAVKGQKFMIANKQYWR